MRKVIALLVVFCTVLIFIVATNKAELRNSSVKDSDRANSQDDFIVHEWGTFTSFSGSDGVKLEFRPLVDSDLPRFVLDRARQSGLPHPFRKLNLRVLQRMETPVTYFYTDRERQVNVRVGFPKGLLTEFYPPVESMAPEFDWLKEPVISDSNLDWGKIWLIPTNQIKVDVGDDKLAEELQSQIVQSLMPKSYVPNHYDYARETDSALVYLERQFDKKRPLAPAGNFFEKFLFYRGVGNFKLPLTLAAIGSDQFTLFNDGPDAIRSLFLVNVEGEQICFSKYDQIGAGEQLVIALSETSSTIDELSEAVVVALVNERLYEKEARAMVKTWRSSWFGEDGTRLFYMLPQPITDELIPLHIEPQPQELVRVLVGRMEIMSPEEEGRIIELVKKSAADRAARAKESASDGESKVSDQESRPYQFPSTILEMGRLAEPALVRVKNITDDNIVLNEAKILLSEITEARIAAVKSE